MLWRQAIAPSFELQSALSSLDPLSMVLLSMALLWLENHSSETPYCRLHLASQIPEQIQN
jgi:hypothetical protein